MIFFEFKNILPKIIKYLQLKGNNLLSMDEKSDEIIRDYLLRIFKEHFQKNNFSYEDWFDQSVFFLKNDHNYHKNVTNTNYFIDIIQSTPNEDDDLIKILLIRSLVRSKTAKIKVSVFLEELVNVLLKLSEDRKRVDALIKKNDAFKTKNIIEEYLNSCSSNIDKINEMMKSSLKIYVSRLEGMTKGEYKFSLIAGILSNKGNFNEEFNEEIFDYKLNHTVKIDDNNQKSVFLEEKGSEYYFPEIELFSYELTGKEKISSSMLNQDTGTNLLYFFLRFENLNKINEDIIISEQKPFLELILHNLKPLMYDYALTKTLYADFHVKNSMMSTIIKLKIEIEFDMITLSTIFNKIVSLLKNIISFKVLIDHKWKTVLKYFPELEEEIFSILGLKDKSNHKKSNCIIY